MKPALLRGKKIVGTEGYILGEMNDLHVDFEKWRVTAFYVILSDEATEELGFKKPFLRRTVICLPTGLIEAVGDVVTLKAPVRSLKDIAEKEVCVDTVKVEGKKVVSSSGATVGVVEGLDVEVDDWKVAGLQVGLSEGTASELGFRKPFAGRVIVVVPSVAVGAIENFVTLDKAISDLKALVECIQSCQLK